MHVAIFIRFRGTHCAEASHQVGRDRVSELGLAIQWLLLKVVDHLHEALKLSCCAEQVNAAFLLDPAVFDLTFSSEGHNRISVQKVINLTK